MRRFWRIFLGLLVWVALFAYLIVAMRYCQSERAQAEIRGVVVKVLDSASQQIITPLMVKGWLAKEGYNFKNVSVSKVNTRAIEDLVESRGFVKHARAYTDLDGVLYIELTQRAPIARVNSVNGYNFYITDDHYILPLQSHFVLYVPIITGVVNPPFGRDFVGSLDKISEENEKKHDKKWRFFSKLINFVEFIRGDDFWNSQIVQINVLDGGGTIEGLTLESGLDGVERDSEQVVFYGEPEVEIVPRVGDQIVLLGRLDNVPEKLDKLLRFYKGAIRYEGWNYRRYIDLRYKGQVVCKDL